MKLRITTEIELPPTEYQIGNKQAFVTQTVCIAVEEYLLHRRWIDSGQPKDLIKALANASYKVEEIK